MIVLSLEFVAAHLTYWGKGAFTWGTFWYLLLIATRGAIVEEAGFRWVFKLLLGNAGLLIGTLLWIGFHQFDASPPPLDRIPGDILFGILFIKLWRGKYWWLSFIVHLMWNIGILLWWQFVLPLLI